MTKNCGNMRLIAGIGYNSGTLIFTPVLLGTVYIKYI